LFLISFAFFFPLLSHKIVRSGPIWTT
jgi:hypothetical protein